MQRFYSLEEIALETNNAFSVPSLRREVRSGRLQAHRSRPSVNAKLLISEANWQKWLSEHAGKWSIRQRPPRIEELI